jgi:hypothetical protein
MGGGKSRECKPCDVGELKGCSDIRMHEVPMSEVQNYNSAHKVAFSRVAWHDRLLRFLPYLPREIPLFATITVSFWGVSEVLAELGGERLRLKDLAIPALATSLVVAAYKAFQKFRAFTPSQLAEESSESRAIYRRGKSGWPFALARQLLVERIELLERVLDRAKTGAEYIPPRTVEETEYFEWLKSRPQLLLRLMRSISIQCIHEIPAVLAVTTGEAGLRSLKDSVVQLAMLYRVATEFETESRSIEPPTEFAEVHEMIYGWSDPIRKGVRDFLAILEKISAIDPKAVQKGTENVPELNLEFESPPNIEVFTSRLSALQNRR